MLMGIVWFIGFLVYVFIGSFVTGLIFKDDTDPGIETLTVIVWPILVVIIIPGFCCLKIIAWTRKITNKRRK